jgi:thiol-disulfide isomerase/thioredoxin
MKKLLYFSSSWCSPCKAFKPVMQRISQTIPVEFIDVDSNPDASIKYNIKSIPTVVLTEGSNELKRFTGVKNETAVRDFYNN